MSPAGGADDTLQVAEIFASIQGESSHVGLPCAFVRLAGCNLRCRWCDTPEAQQDGIAMARSEVLTRTLAYSTRLVELTGGEPLLQPGSLPLLRDLCDAGRTVLLETNGTCNLSEVDGRVHKIVDLKAPSTGFCEHNRLEHLTALTPRDEIKFVLADRNDYEWMQRTITEHRLHQLGAAVLASCVWRELDPRQLVEWVLADKLDVRVQVQLHKMIWGADAKGV